MNHSQNEKFESFDDSLHYYALRISPFVTKDMFDEISKNPSNIFKFINKETYESVTKHANYECEPFFDKLKVKIYLNKKGGQLIQSEKCLATYVLVQVFDDDQLISEELKEL